MKPPLLALAVLASSAWAQHVAVPSEVTTVITAGRWADAGASGSYRVVVVRDGWEHVWSRVYVEWLPDPTDRNAPDPKPLSVKELIPPGVAQGSAVLTATAKGQQLGRLEVTVLATSNMEPGAKSQRFTFVATQPGAAAFIRTPSQPAGR